MNAKGSSILQSALFAHLLLLHAEGRLDATVWQLALEVAFIIGREDLLLDALCSLALLLLIPLRCSFSHQHGCLPESCRLVQLFLQFLQSMVEDLLGGADVLERQFLDLILAHRQDLVGTELLHRRLREVFTCILLVGDRSLHIGFHHVLAI